MRSRLRLNGWCIFQQHFLHQQLKKKRTFIMITQHISTILWITGIMTMLPLLQFFLPAMFIKRFNQTAIHDDVGLMFARHWGALVFVLGGLLVYAASHSELRGPIIAAALIEKAALVLLIIINLRQPFGKGFVLTAAFDGACCVIYALYLAGLA